MTRILITGAAGLVGQSLLERLAQTDHVVIATDIKEPMQCPSNVQYYHLDVRGDDADRVIGETQPEVVVHLASIVTPPKESTRAFEYDVDVNGTRRIIDACLTHHIRRLVVTSSGAAYGYHADNSARLTEDDPIRGNVDFAYAHHKRLVEEMLAQVRETHPSLEQVIFRVGTILGEGVDNQITALFQKKRLVAVWGSEGAFVFIWTKDLARIVMRGATDGPAGIFNVAGDGALPTQQLAQMMGKGLLSLPAGVLKVALGLAKPLGLSRYGPEQVRFLQYRPVLDNTRLKKEFGYTPEKSSAETFALWWEASQR